MSLIRASRRSRLPIFGRPTCNLSANAGGLPKIARSHTSGLALVSGISGFRRALYYTALTSAKISNLIPPKLLVIGSSGHASVLLDAIELMGGYEIAGY